ncbi:hypothetical protein PR003_g1018 [Phytophthora rubi]|uniref:Uncharacterized protein n=1 Tax=Phytophthora rubi TaxID=129364 RepID=A0A6A4G384_9STRA|nr:hypothetical protein PR003_g1018 [Phytophthora rubi]
MQVLLEHNRAEVRRNHSSICAVELKSPGGPISGQRGDRASRSSAPANQIAPVSIERARIGHDWTTTTPTWSQSFQGAGVQPTACT